MDGPWTEGDASGMIMTQKDKRGTMRQFLLQNEKGVFIHKLALSKALTPEVNTHFTPADAGRSDFPAHARNQSSLGRTAQSHA